ncbi:hypothetical protein D584_01353 [Brucella intermedia M86]|uniref:Uncharacterized protein n=1 Tax=Brucella intermedia M86 TaxID=1234597 RepID=M5JSL3_9HYPH|nr:hypothetical protein D584_01353 [Brucella intermedia M86]
MECRRGYVEVSGDLAHAIAALVADHRFTELRFGKLAGHLEASENGGNFLAYAVDYSRHTAVEGLGGLVSNKLVRNAWAEEPFNRKAA